MDLLNSPSLKLPFCSSSKPLEEKRKYQHVSTQLTLSCSYRSKKRKLSQGYNGSVTATTLFYDHTHVVALATRNLLDGSCMNSQIKKETEEEESEVSTELSLSLGKKTISEKDCKKPEKSARVSSELSLSIRVKFDKDVCKIKKTLKKSDLGDLSRLLVGSSLVNEHILPLLGEEQVKKIRETVEGIEVRVLDCDTSTEHGLVFKRWDSSKSYVFLKGWTSGFVKRRHLETGDTIGLYWDQFNSRFNFSILGRA